MLHSRKYLFPCLLIVVSITMFTSCSAPTPPQLFTRLDHEKTGVDFQNTLFEGEALNVLNYIYFYNGGGVAIGDINNDGLPDILFTGNMVKNRLFLNKGNFKFEDITAKSGIAAMEGWCTGATMVDINGDGKMDIYICRSADANPARRKNLLFINNGVSSTGEVTFTEKAAEYGLADEGFSTQAAFFDYDKDGDLDMFLINHSLHQYATGAVDNPGWRKQNQPAFECKLYRNDWNDSLHHAVYTDVSAKAGITSDVLTFGLGLAVSDLNNDGWPDVYVSNDFNEPDYLFMNNGDGTFTEKLRDAMDQTSLYSMGNDAADFNNDGLVDLMTLDMLPEDNHTQKMHSGAENFNKFQQLFNRGFYYQYSRNMLQKNNGDGTFSEIGQLAGVSNTDWSWSALFSDFDNDGNKDLLVTNGYVKDYTDMDFLRYSADKAVQGNTGQTEEAIKEVIGKMPTNQLSSYIFRNNGNNTFTKMTKEWGLDRKTVSAGAAYADLNNDGAMDLVINTTNDFAGIYQNNPGLNGNNNFLRIILQGDAKNSTGIGAKVKLFCGGRILYQEQQPVRGFQSSVDPVLNFGVGHSTVIDSILVIWPNDRFQWLKQIKAGQTIKINLADAAGVWDYKVSSSMTAENTPPLGGRGGHPYFKKSPDPGIMHVENEFNDFDIQPLLLNFLSRQGPCMAKADVNHDGREDIFIGGSKGHPSRLYLQTAAGTFIESSQSSIALDSSGETVAAEFFDADGDGNIDLLTGSGGYEFAPNDPALQSHLYLNDGKGHFRKKEDALPPLLISVGCVKAADLDGDGDMDLFLGGRVVPGSYPCAPESVILLNDGKGHFTDATDQVAPALRRIGMVTDALWIDLNNDHQPDLVIVGEWMPIKVFLNDHGKLTDASSTYIKFPSSGLWNKILAADFNGDGKPDLVVGNLGENAQFKASEKEPISLYYKDFDNNGLMDPIFCYFINGVSYPAASRDDLTGQLPGLKKKFIEYHSYADATINDLFSPEQLKDAGLLKAEILSTVYLENNGTAGFTRRPLPQDAQCAPVYAMAALDANHDGKMDLLLTGNNSMTRIRFGRYRANHGILLTGDGKGNFSYVPQYQSGLNLRDDIRSIEVLQSGKFTDLFFGANNSAVKSYRLQ